MNQSKSELATRLVKEEMRGHRRPNFAINLARFTFISREQIESYD